MVSVDVKFGIVAVQPWKHYVYVARIRFMITYQRRGAWAHQPITFKPWCYGAGRHCRDRTSDDVDTLQMNCFASVLLCRASLDLKFTSSLSHSHTLWRIFSYLLADKNFAHLLSNLEIYQTPAETPPQNRINLNQLHCMLFIDFPDGCGLHIYQRTSDTS